MNKTVDYTKLGGFPFTQYSGKYMQDAYSEPLSALAAFCGDRVILSGLVPTNGIVTNGWISFQGEILPFIGGVITENFIIEESRETRRFEDNEVKDAYVTRVAKFGSGSTQFPYSSLQRIGTVADICRRGDLKDIFINNADIPSQFDNSGLGIGIRIGWAICNGLNGTPDFGGRVVVGYKASNLKYNDVGEEGGTETVSLTAEQNGPHNHSESAPGPDGNHPGGNGGYPRPNAAVTKTTGNSGAGAPHNNMQPYKVAIKIIKL